MTDKYYAFPFRFARFKNNAGIHLASLSREVKSALDDWHLTYIDQALCEFSGIPEEIVALALRTAPVLQTSDRLRLATAFYL
jgi:hypothetical protein